MSEKDYICVNCSNAIGLPLECSDCGKKTCPVCGGDVVTNEEYDENMRLNNEN